MGCWNETCMVTGLPIMVEDPCVAVILAKTPYELDGCYPTEGFTPLLTVPGTYDDYGGLENIEDNGMLCQFMETGLLYAKEGDGGKPFESKDKNELLVGISRNEVYIPGGRLEFWAEDIPLQLVFLRWPVFQMAEEYLSHNGSLCQKYKQICEDFIKAKSQDNPGDGDLVSIMKSDLASKSLWSVLTWQCPNPGAKEFMDKATSKCTADTIPIMYGTMALNYLLNDLRMSWHIPSGRGSQSILNEAYRLFLGCYMGELTRLSWTYDRDM